MVSSAHELLPIMRWMILDIWYGTVDVIIGMVRVADAAARIVRGDVYDINMQGALLGGDSALLG